MKTKAQSYHPAAFESVVDSIKGVSIQGFFNSCSESEWPIFKRFEENVKLPNKIFLAVQKIRDVSKLGH